VKREEVDSRQLRVERGRKRGRIAVAGIGCGSEEAKERSNDVRK